MKILVSYGYGAGWVSWHHGSNEEKLFMATYKPFIDWIESGKKLPRDEDHELIKQFYEDFCERFGEDEDLPYIGGLPDCVVEHVNGKFKIKEYDGHESVEERDDNKEWLG